MHAILRSARKQPRVSCALAAVVAILACSAACSSKPTTQEGAAPTPAAAEPPASSAPTPAASSAPPQQPAAQTPSGKKAAPGTKEVDVESVKVNLDEIFPRGQGRELLLNNCTTCHTFVPIVTLQMTADAWDRNRSIHRERVPNLSEDEISVLYSYLKANFNPKRPPAKLPQALLDTWTAY